MAIIPPQPLHRISVSFPADYGSTRRYILTTKVVSIVMWGQTTAHAKSPLPTDSAVGRKSARTSLGPDKASAVAANVFIVNETNLHSGFLALAALYRTCQVQCQYCAATLLTAIGMERRRVL
jgi:hypothetical protein